MKANDRGENDKSKNARMPGDGGDQLQIMNARMQDRGGESSILQYAQHLPFRYNDCTDRLNGKVFVIGV